jgi:hypothetical protein
LNAGGFRNIGEEQNSLPDMKKVTGPDSHFLYQHRLLIFECPNQILSHVLCTFQAHIFSFAPLRCDPCAHNSPFLPIYNGEEWGWKNCSDLYLSEEGVERWKTAFYDLEGWNSKTGYPKRETLEMLGLREVADVLQSSGKLG